MVCASHRTVDEESVVVGDICTVDEENVVLAEVCTVDEENVVYAPVCTVDEGEGALVVDVWTGPAVGETAAKLPNVRKKTYLSCLSLT